MDDEDKSKRATRDDPVRTDADRRFGGLFKNAYGFDPESANQGYQSAAQRFAGAHGTGGWTGIDQVEHDSVNGAEETLALLTGSDDVIGPFVDAFDYDSIFGAGTETVQAVMSLWFKQWRAWTEAATRMMDYGSNDPGTAFGEITGHKQSSPQARPGIQAVVLCNRELEVSLNWKSGVPNDELFILGPFPLAREGSSTQAGSGLEITIRRSLSGDAQVFDVVAPDDLAAGTYAGIIYSADGVDHGHISLKLHD